MTKQPGMFWSEETLGERLKMLIDPFAPGGIDCAAYTLAIGPEVYVSPSDQAVDPTTVTIRKLSDGEAFTIPPGQFPFVLTEEVVSVPADALAFISIRAKTKFRGLVNVSGFHVDPGYRGQLTFAVFNAGPVPVHLKRGQPIFLIWYASLDFETAFKNDLRHPTKTTPTPPAITFNNSPNPKQPLRVYPGKNPYRPLCGFLLKNTTCGRSWMLTGGSTFSNTMTCRSVRSTRNS